MLDVNRSLKRFPPGIEEADRPVLQDQLTRLIVRVLVAHPGLHYYQVHINITCPASILLSRAITTWPSPSCSWWGRPSATRSWRSSPPPTSASSWRPPWRTPWGCCSSCKLRPCLAAFRDRTSQLSGRYPIIRRRSPELHGHLVRAELGTIFALPWLITWFGHVLPQYSDVVRLYDFFLAGPPLMPVYLATAIVLYREQEILSTGSYPDLYFS